MSGEKGLLVITLVSLTLAFTPPSRAAHATNFLNELHAEITNRLGNAGTNLSPPQVRALRTAQTSLSRNSKTLAADLGLLASAARPLSTAFATDDTLGTLQTNALNAYFAEAHAQRDAVTNRLGTNVISRGLRNRLQSALTALERADANTNDVRSRAHALAAAFNRLKGPAAQILSRFEVPFEAPAEILTGQHLTLIETADIPQNQTEFFFETEADDHQRYLHYKSDNPEEVGIWTYEKLTAKTAAAHCNVTVTDPGGSTAPHDMSLTFTSASGGTFTGVNCFGEHLQGTFVLY